MRRSKWLWLLGFVLIAICAVSLLILTGEGGLPRKPMDPRPIDVTRLTNVETERLGWDPKGLDAAFTFAARLSSDTLMIITDDKTVGVFGDVGKQYEIHSAVKAFLSGLISQHIGSGTNQIPLEATLEQLGIDDFPNPLTPLQRQATAHHLLKSASGINHAAAAEARIMKAEKDRRLGDGDNEPGTIWAYNNWDYNALLTILEERTGMTLAEAFEVGIAQPTGMLNHTPDAVFYREAPELSQHRAPALRMSASDLARYGKLYLDKGIADGNRLLPESWVNRIATDFMKTESDDALRHGHGYLWWIPGPDTGLPEGSFWAWGLGQQALFVIPPWQTIIVHQSDTTEFIKRWIGMVQHDGVEPEAALEQIILTCLDPDNYQSAFCIEHRFIRPKDFAELISLIAAARR
ncbi:MAG: serine hydrolase [Alphaproteobacteria bacterium GM202ARS2]|nr:serine hydrolase [Alphaproteobacteria bacterium GM202ARS2]